MRCENCKKHTATVRIKHNRDGKKVDSYLCDACSCEIELSLLVESLFKGLKMHESTQEKKHANQAKTCAGCGITLRGIIKGDGLGCSNCYKTFNKELVPMIKQAHGSYLHEGKLPKRGGQEIERDIKLRKLKELMHQAVAEEDFEKAAMYRDDIKAISTLNGVN